MHAMVLKKIETPLEWTELFDRIPGHGQIRVRIGACGVCRTDLHVVDGELPNQALADLWMDDLKVHQYSPP